MSTPHEQCQILVVSTPHEVGYDTIRRLTQSDSPLTPDQNNRISWTISNRYYDAPVYFQFQKLSIPPAKPLWPPEVDDVHAPAIIYVFDKSQLNRDAFESLLPAFEAHEAEICLAIGVNHPSASEPSASASRYSIEGQEEDDLEAFFMRHGFEYVNADASRAPPDGDSVRFDVAGLPRVIDSLSTIMWPSMKRKPSSTRKSLGLAIYEDDDDEEEEEEEEEEDAPAALDPILASQLLNMSLSSDTFEGRLALQAHHAAARSETEALEAWLNEDEDAGEGADEEEDFADFIGASGSTSGVWAESPTSDADPPAEYAPLDEEDDSSLPTSSEVLHAQTRIFGPLPPPLSPSADAPSHAGLEDQFDLSAALGALQAMRDEIGGMQDDGERRRAAARVALGLVRGLGLDEGDVEDVMAHAE